MEAKESHDQNPLLKKTENLIIAYFVGQKREVKNSSPSDNMKGRNV